MNKFVRELLERRQEQIKSYLNTGAENIEAVKSELSDALIRRECLLDERNALEVLLKEDFNR